MPAAMVRAMNELAADARPGDVVLQVPGPKRYPPPPLVLIPLRIPYTQTIPYMTQFASRADLDTRLALVRRFFATDNAAEAREIAAQLGARYFALYGSDTVNFDPDAHAAFRNIHRESNVSVYAIPPPAPQSR